ncbi:MAG: ATP-binding protein [Chitinophagaceae bacterium]
MNIKLRFALLFTLFAAVILFIASAIIFLLYKNYRYDDFYNRVKNQVVSLHDTYERLHETTLIENLLKFEHKSVLPQEHKLIINDSGVLLHSYPKTASFNYNQNLLFQIKSSESFRFIHNDKQAIGKFFPKTKLYVIVAAFDSTGLRKERNLLYIISFVYIGALIITAFFAFLFVQQAFKPLVKLSKQMQRTTALNMTERVDEAKASDEVQQIAKNFNAMLDRLNIAFENQKSFVQHASHELRTPLATMLSQTEAAIGRDLSVAEYQKVLQSLKEEQNKLIELANSLLLLSQYEKITYSNQWLVLRVDELLYETIASCNTNFPEIKIEMVFENTPFEEKELFVKGNDELLRAAFTNLIKNAYYYSTNKTVFISINSLNGLQISFINTGKQLSDEEVRKMLVPFFRGKNAAFVKGFGVGLSIIHKIVDIHNGKLAYEKKGDDTNVFTVSFPLFQNEELIP